MQNIKGLRDQLFLTTHFFLQSGQSSEEPSSVHLRMQWRWKQWLHCPSMGMQSSPGILHVGQGDSKANWQMAQDSAFWMSHFHVATACQLFIFTFILPKYIMFELPGLIFCGRFQVIIVSCMSKFDIERSTSFVSKLYDESLLPALVQFIKIPNLSRGFDPEWASNGNLEKAAQHIQTWVEGLKINGLKTEIIKHEGYSPLLFTEIAGEIADKTIMFYGHFDKQPPMVGWDDNKGPTIPVIEDGKLYGRGGADDGYSTFSSMLAVKAVQEQGIPLPRIVMITEGDEQTGGHIEYYVEKLKEKIGNPDVIFCLDSGTLDFEHLWATNSLRGYLAGILRVKVLTEGVHSGDSSGIVPSAYRIMNMLISRLEDLETGQINKTFAVDIPPNRYKEAHDLVSVLSESAFKPFPFHKGTKPVSDNKLESVLNRTWRPQLSVTGIAGMPPAETSGNVMLPECACRLSLRLPPTLEAHKYAEVLKDLLTHNPPYSAEVTFDQIVIGNGWNLPDFSPWLEKALNEAAKTYFKGDKMMLCGEGGSIPLMGLLNSIWPKAQFIVTGVLGPGTNAHGPNEFMPIEYTKKLTQAMALVLARSAQV